jgi:hypothetical protein
MNQARARIVSPARHFGLSLRGEPVCVFRDWLPIFDLSPPKLSADYADWNGFGKDKLKEEDGTADYAGSRILSLSHARALALDREKEEQD